MKTFKELKNNNVISYKFQKSNKKSNTKSGGFALLEVFIALLVITTMASTLFISGITVNNYDKRKTTHTRMKYVQKILNQYVVTYGRLPCPSDPTLPSAPESLSNGVCSSALSFNSSNTYYGSIPVELLGISREYLQDGWGNKIMYIVPKELTYYNSNNRTILYYSDRSSGYQIAKVNAGVTAYEAESFTNYISTHYNNGTLDVLINSKNIYSLLSSGDNGLGAYTISGTPNSSTGANSTTGELANVLELKTDNKLYMNQTTTGGTGKIDDILYSTTITDIVANNQSMIYCNASASFMSDGIATLLPPESGQYHAPNSMVQFAENCGTCQGSSNVRKYVECLSGGNWGTAFSRPCICQQNGLV